MRESDCRWRSRCSSPSFRRETSMAPHFPPAKRKVVESTIAPAAPIAAANPAVARPTTSRRDRNRRHPAATTPKPIRLAAKFARRLAVSPACQPHLPGAWKPGSRLFYPHLIPAPVTVGGSFPIRRLALGLRGAHHVSIVPPDSSAQPDNSYRSAAIDKAVLRARTRCAQGNSDHFRVMSR